MLTRSRAAQLRREALAETPVVSTCNTKRRERLTVTPAPSTRNRKRREKLAEVPVQSTSNGVTRVLRQTPYRLAKQKASAKLTTKKKINHSQIVIDQLYPNLRISTRCKIFNNRTASPNNTRWVQQLFDISPNKTPLISSNIFSKANLFIAKMKIKPKLLLILSAVLATLVFTVSHNSTDDRTEFEIWDRYKKFSHNMLELQKEYIHQSAWFWHCLRVTGWRALTEPLYSMPLGLLIVIPSRQEHVGRCLATKIVESFNQIHNQKTMKQSDILLFYRQTDTTLTIKELSLAIQSARDAHMSAVLIDQLEKLPRAIVPILDNFIHPYGYNAENKFLVFTLYLPSVHCNSEFVWDYLSDVWLKKVINQPSLVRNLMYNTVFLHPGDDHVECK